MKRMRDFPHSCTVLAFVAVFTLALVVAPSWGIAEDSRPNIIFIMADDLGYGQLGCYGQKKIRTPRLDRMAREGLRFTQAYAGCTVCASSRSVLLTGLHTGHTPVRGNMGDWKGVRLQPPGSAGTVQSAA